jgi:alkyl sulfatase BDS1-like metallo-beta-lactamase superfamily hydrolase
MTWNSAGRACYGLTIENAVLHYTPKALTNADASIRIPKATLDQIQLKQKTIDQAISAGELKIEGKREAFGQFLVLLDDFPFWFNIVTP